MSVARNEQYGPPSSWLVPAVLTTLLCMPLTGVVAVYYAAQVRVRWSYDDLEGADKAARRARLWVFIGLALFVLLVAVGAGSGYLFDLSERWRD